MSAVTMRTALDAPALLEQLDQLREAAKEAIEDPPFFAPDSSVAAWRGAYAQAEGYIARLTWGDLGAGLRLGTVTVRTWAGVANSTIELLQYVLREAQTVGSWATFRVQVVDQTGADVGDIAKEIKENLPAAALGGAGLAVALIVLYVALTVRR